MFKFNINPKNHYQIIIGLSLILFPIIFWTPFTNTALMTDEVVIIDPLRNITSIMGYIQTHLAGKLYDFQPVRDLSHVFDLIVINLTGFENFHLFHNLVLFCLATCLVYRLLLFFFSKQTSLFLALIFLFHPGTFHIFVEVTNRKHILSFIFYVISYIYFLNSRRSIKEANRSKSSYIKSTVFYALSILSQPINAFGFLLFGLHLLFEKAKIKEIIRLLFPYGVLFLILISLNLIHYHYFHYSKTGIHESFFVYHLPNLIFAIAMPIRQFFIPLFFSNFYVIVSSTVLLTIMMAPLVYFSAFKINKKLLLISVFHFVLILFALYGHKSNVLNNYYVNSYGITPFFTFLMLIGIFLNKFKVKKVFYILFIPLIFISLSYSVERTSKYNFYRNMASIEPECRALQSVVYLAIRDDYIEDIKKFGPKWLSQKCKVIGSGLTYQTTFINTFLLLVSDDFSYKEKSDLFDRKYNNLPDRIFLKGMLEFQTNGPSEYFYSLLEQLKGEKYHSLFVNDSFIQKRFNEHCSNNEKPGCRIYEKYKREIYNIEIQFQYNNDIRKN